MFCAKQVTEGRPCWKGSRQTFPFLRGRLPVTSEESPGWKDLQGQSPTHGTQGGTRFKALSPRLQSSATTTCTFLLQKGGQRHLWRHRYPLTAYGGEILQPAWTQYLTWMWPQRDEMSSGQTFPLLITFWLTKSSPGAVRWFSAAPISHRATWGRDSDKLQEKPGLKIQSCSQKAGPKVRKGERIWLRTNKHHFIYQKISPLTELPTTSARQFCNSRFYCAGSRGEKTMFYKEKKLDMVLGMFISFIILCMNLL